MAEWPQLYRIFALILALPAPRSGSTMPTFVRGSRAFSWMSDVAKHASPVSSLIDSAERGEVTAAEALFTTLYTDLRRLARYELSRRGGGLTLTATALLHEAYLDISQRDGAMFVDRGRFMAYASRVMRGLIIDYARNRRAQKRGGKFEMTTLETDIGPAAVDDRELTAISDALDELAAVDAVAGGSRRPEILLRILVRRDRRRCAASRNARCSASGTRHGSTSTAPSRQPPARLSSLPRSVDSSLGSCNRQPPPRYRSLARRQSHLDRGDGNGRRGVRGVARRAPSPRSRPR